MLGVAVAEKVRVERPFAAAVAECFPATVPSVQAALASPAVFVRVVVGVTLPLPAVTIHVT